MSGQDQNQKQRDSDCIDYETLIAQLDGILEQAVSDALEGQYAELDAGFRKESKKLSDSRSFWRRTAVAEGLVIFGAALTGVIAYRLRE